MSKLTFKIAMPMVLAGAFIMVVFIALRPEQIDLSFYLVLIFLAVFVFFYGYASGQVVAFPVKKLLKKATDLSQGDFKTRVYMETKDELGQLAQIFNKIAENLEETRGQAECTEKSVGIKVRAKTQILEETINALEQKIKNRAVETERFAKKIEELEAAAKTKDQEIAELKQKIENLKPKNHGKNNN